MRAGGHVGRIAVRLGRRGGLARLDRRLALLLRRSLGLSALLRRGLGARLGLDCGLLLGRLTDFHLPLLLRQRLGALLSGGGLLRLTLRRSLLLLLGERLGARLRLGGDLLLRLDPRLLRGLLASERVAARLRGGGLGFGLALGRGLHPGLRLPWLAAAAR